MLLFGIGRPVSDSIGLLGIDCLTPPLFPPPQTLPPVPAEDAGAAGGGLPFDAPFPPAAPPFPLFGG